MNKEQGISNHKRRGTPAACPFIQEMFNAQRSIFNAHLKESQKNNEQTNKEYRMMKERLKVKGRR